MEKMEMESGFWARKVKNVYSKYIAQLKRNGKSSLGSAYSSCFSKFKRQLKETEMCDSADREASVHVLCFFICFLLSSKGSFLGMKQKLFNLSLFKVRLSWFSAPLFWVTWLTFNKLETSKIFYLSQSEKNINKAILIWKNTHHVLLFTNLKLCMLYIMKYMLYIYIQKCFTLRKLFMKIHFIHKMSIM